MKMSSEKLRELGFDESGKRIKKQSSEPTDNPITLPSVDPVASFIIKPMGKVRMVAGDKWVFKLPESKLSEKQLKRKAFLQKYWDYKDELRKQAAISDFVIPSSNYWLVFTIPMAKSWSKKKKREYDGQPHQQKPDKDNLEKAFLDCLCDEDSHVFDGRVTKIWGQEGRIDVYDLLAL